ncbi:hypothetical protein NHX12_034526 [Muraenolepis orangiensis]|uniref:Uncharacterized protein n=1 Tax=Muraenolepis orangiensis TaxID=630683 RepID=A0A9Q0D7B9_9TELE|nr:hypothetical protein NHX12_034526 [Muraenolepis orangiensis]
MKGLSGGRPAQLQLTSAAPRGAPSTRKPRNESPGRIRHPVHSVQRLFTKSHSLPSGGRWSSDDNLDSDSTYRTPSVMSRHPPEHLSHCYPLDAVQAHLAGDLTLKTSRSNNDVKCSACDGVAMS